MVIKVGAPQQLLSAFWGFVVSVPPLQHFFAFWYLSLSAYFNFGVFVAHIIFGYVVFVTLSIFWLCGIYSCQNFWFCGICFSQYYLGLWYLFLSVCFWVCGICSSPSVSVIFLKLQLIILSIKYNI